MVKDHHRIAPQMYQAQESTAASGEGFFMQVPICREPGQKSDIQVLLTDEDQAPFK